MLEMKTVSYNYLLASLPDTFDMLVTTLEANNEEPKMETVTERLLYEKQDLKDRTAGSRPAIEEAMTIKHNKWRGPRCHHCKKYGHGNGVAKKQF